MALEPFLKKAKAQEGRVGRPVEQMERRPLHRIVVAQIERFAKEAVDLEPLPHHLAVGHEQPREGRRRRGGEHLVPEIPEFIDVRALGRRHDRRPVAVVRIGVCHRHGRDERLDAFVRQTPVKARARQKDVHLSSLDRMGKLLEREVRDPHAILAEVLLERLDGRGHDLLVGSGPHVLHNGNPHGLLYIDGRRHESVGGHPHQGRIHRILRIVAMRQRLSAKRQERKQNSGRDLQDGPARAPPAQKAKPMKDRRK